LTSRLNRPAASTWLVSSNPFDVIGAKVAGLKVAWIRRNPRIVFDPWDIPPDLVASNLLEFAQQLATLP
jgi:2-haloacid dehalogenase